MGELMAGKEKKIAAALAAVSLYLQQEEASAQVQAPPEPKGVEFSLWGQSGSQEMMSMRKLIQLRTFTRF